MLWQDIREKHPKKWLVIEARKYFRTVCPVFKTLAGLQTLV
jgi:hypothetical protein